MYALAFVGRLLGNVVCDTLAITSIFDIADYSFGLAVLAYVLSHTLCPSRIHKTYRRILHLVRYKTNTIQYHLVVRKLAPMG